VNKEFLSNLVFIRVLLAHIFFSFP